MDHATIERARAGDWEVILPPSLPAPRVWFGELRGFDYDAARAGAPRIVKCLLPYSDPANPDPAARERRSRSGLAAEFSHSLDAQIGGQLAAFARGQPARRRASALSSVKSCAPAPCGPRT